MEKQSTVFSILKNRDALLCDYKSIKERDWWIIIKFPLIFIGILSIHFFAPIEKTYYYTLAAFLFFSWFDLAYGAAITNKKLDVLYKIELNRDITNHENTTDQQKAQ